MGYSEALEQQVGLIEFFKANRDLLPSSIDHPGDTGTSILDALEYGDTYYWAPAVAGLLSAVIGDFPQGARWSQEQVPSALGFMKFAVPPGWKNSETGNWTALTWLTWRIGMVGGEKPGVNLGSGWLSGVRGEQCDVPSYLAGQWLESETLLECMERSLADTRPPDADPASDGACVLTMTLFAATMALMAQRILVSPPQRAERPARRRLERAGWIHEPLIRVVELRRKATQQQKSDDPVNIAWTHQWVVSGHWHNYWVGPEDKRILQPRWLMPFIKGPANLPLKPPRAKVFAVVR